MRQPAVYTAKVIKQWDCNIESEDGWIPARPVGHNLFPFMFRFYLAWLVLVGKFDAIDWEDKKRCKLY